MGTTNTSEKIFNEFLDSNIPYENECVASEEKWEIKRHYSLESNRKLIPSMTKQDYLDDFGSKE